MRQFAGNRAFAIGLGLPLSLGLLLSSTTSIAYSQSLREMAENKVGKESQLWIAEPGDTSLNRWDPRELFEDSGIVLEWDSQKIVLIRPDAASPATIPGDYVVRIEPAWANENGAKIHRLYSERQYKLVVIKGQEIVTSASKSGLPPWQLRVILAEMVESSSALGKPGIAGKVFVALANYNPPQLLLATIPLPWGESAFSEAGLPEIQSLSEEWISQENEAVQLLGAAWLLSGVKRPLAIETLNRLAKTSKSPFISAYARTQLWRIAPPAEVLSDRLPGWLSERDKLLLPLQAGPTMLLAERLQQAGQSNLAIPEWLRIATLHSDRYHLAIKAIPKASAALRDAGRKEEADRVQSLLDRYKTDANGKK